MLVPSEVSPTLTRLFVSLVPLRQARWFDACTRRDADHRAGRRRVQRRREIEAARTDLASETSGRWSLGEVTAEPDESVATHVHPGEPEAFIILDGSGTARIDGRGPPCAGRRRLHPTRHRARAEDSERGSLAGRLAHTRAGTRQAIRQLSPHTPEQAWATRASRAAADEKPRHIRAGGRRGSAARRTWRHPPTRRAQPGRRAKHP